MDTNVLWTDRWIHELIDRWAEDAHFHYTPSKLKLGLKDTLELSKLFLIFCISKQYHLRIVNLFHKKSQIGIIIEQASS